jgi:hypothetical protein
MCGSKTYYANFHQTAVNIFGLNYIYNADNHIASHLY